MRSTRLRDFLRERRGRVHPKDVGLPSYGRRRVPGLRIDEVAELVEVSPTWYRLFELGTSGRRFSVAFVQRVADALRLDERDRASLYRLALPEVAAATEYYERSASDGALRSLATIRDFSRHVGAASSFGEATAAAVETVQKILAPSSATVASLERSDASPEAIASGPRGPFAGLLFAQTALAVNYPVRFGATVMCEDAPSSEEAATIPAVVHLKADDGRVFEISLTDLQRDAYQEFNSRLESRSKLVVGLFERGVFRGNMIALWTEPRSMSPLEVDAIETVRAILELAAAGVYVRS